MGAITAYSISVAIILAIEYLVYKSLLANTTFHRLNRAILLSCYVVALAAIPAWHLIKELLLPGDIDSATASITIGNPTVALTGNAAPQGSSLVIRAIPLIYFAGVIAMTIMTLIAYLRMFRVIRDGKQISRGNVTIVVAETKVSPFSWGNYIVVSPDDIDNEIIIAHETAHINNRDTFDLIFAQLFIIFNWFNPVAYLMRRELSAVHEYKVDQQILDAGVNASDYQMLLIKKTAGLRFQSIANSLNHSQLKNRLTMMLKSKSKRRRSLYAAALLPAALLAVSMTNLPAVASTIRKVAAVSYDKVSEKNPAVQEFSETFAAETVAPGSNANYDITPKDPEPEPDVLPQYPGGEMAMLNSIMDELKYPENLEKEGVTGLVVIQFTVNTDGTMSDFEFKKKSGSEELDAEALRGLKEGLKLKWEPGTVDGKPVRCTYTLPVRFAIRATTDKKAN